MRSSSHAERGSLRLLSLTFINSSLLNGYYANQVMSRTWVNAFQLAILSERVIIGAMKSQSNANTPHGLFTDCREGRS